MNTHKFNLARLLVNGREISGVTLLSAELSGDFTGCSALDCSGFRPSVGRLAISETLAVYAGVQFSQCWISLRGEPSA